MFLLKPSQKRPIVTERLILRAAEDDDWKAYYGWFSSPEAMTYWSCAPHTTTEPSKNFVDSMIKSQFNGIYDFTVCLRDGAEPSHSRAIGKAGLYDGKEIGYILHPDYWGKGYAREALVAILDRYFADITEVPQDTQPKEGEIVVNGKVKADIDPRNAASIKLLTRLGFVEVGRAEKTFETHLGWCDSVYLELSKPEAK
ncbi:hypothetical protein CVT24_009840 [Panaeolus cyanescens]|uniref:N-acetyltransferase domain-containing protein n=1 Tax=Panaeolus cyanescens TaxID=181874 RepID=A0A409VY32_9AGAR|nr:hypothetical protein CVT24_009840 [Panaeolus cyanescens]